VIRGSYRAGLVPLGLQSPKRAVENRASFHNASRAVGRQRYPEGLTGEQLPLTARIICVADVYQALCEKRPYRDSLPAKVVFSMMAEDASTRLDSECLTALKERRPEEAVNGMARATGAW
jgi:hypothetical protein